MPNARRMYLHQRGSALIVGLILLLVITVLAVTGMSTASTELIMAGNEQYRQNAFQAAETGIEEALRDLPMVPQTGVPVTVGPVAVPGSTTDSYEVTSQYMGEDEDIAGFSQGKFTGLHYRVQSTGTSARNAVSRHEQGAYVIATAGGGGSIGSLGGAPPPVEN
ncbi:MAG: pilus assembly PilX N-terminal domain-containing protein [Pseudomonadota bacterium]|jgi:Tfp pilus assembly protein PilX|nr:MAG: hypothetical protein DIU56_05110 [Pseudomonadota bacterium]